MNLWRTLFNPLKRFSIEIQGYVFPLALQMLTNMYSIFMLNQDNRELFYKRISTFYHVPLTNTCFK